MMYDSSDLTELLALALGAVRAGARLALDPGQALRIETKRNRNDVVTQVDRAVEALMARRLAPAGYPLVGEEGHAAGGWAGRVWVLDPIDGTLNYIAVHRHWAISLALVEDGRPVAGVVADPVDDRVYTAVVGAGARVRRLFVESDAGAELARVADVPLAEGIVIAHLHGLEEVPRLARIIGGTRGLRCYGAAALEMVEAAAGRAGAVVHTGLQPWDVAAGALLCAETGAVVTRLNGEELDVREPGSLLAGTPSAHAEMLRRLAGARPGV